MAHTHNDKDKVTSYYSSNWQPGYNVIVNETSDNNNIKIDNCDRVECSGASNSSKRASERQTGRERRRREIEREGERLKRVKRRRHQRGKKTRINASKSNLEKCKLPS